MKLRWYHYRAVIIGQESGHVTVLSFVRFHTEAQAIVWCVTQNRTDHHSLGLVRFGYQEIP